MSDNPAKKQHEVILKTLWLAIGFLLMALIAYGSLAPSVDTSQGFKYQDKVIHAGAYCVMSGWFLQACRSFSQCVFVVVLAFLFGLGIEIAQSHTVNRFAEISDLIANTLGILIASAVRRWQPITCCHYLANR